MKKSKIVQYKFFLFSKKKRTNVLQYSNFLNASQIFISKKNVLN